MCLCINVSVCVNVCVHTGANTHEVYNLLKVIGKDHHHQISLIFIFPTISHLSYYYTLIKEISLQ